MDKKPVETNSGELKTYEIGYLLSPLVPAEGLEEMVDALYRAAIEEQGGKLIFKTTPKLRPLAYPVTKMSANKKISYTDGYFGAVKFQLTAEALVSVKLAFDKQDTILRSLIITIPKGADRALSPRRNLGARRPKSAEAVPGSEIDHNLEMSKEEIDKEIEGLLDPVKA